MNLPDKIEPETQKYLCTYLSQLTFARAISILVENQNQLIDYLAEREPKQDEPEDYSIEAFNRFLGADPIADLDKLTIRRKKNHEI